MYAGMMFCCFFCYCYFYNRYCFFLVLLLVLQLLLRPILLFPCKSFWLYWIFNVITLCRIGVGFLFCVFFLLRNESFSDLGLTEVLLFAFFFLIFSKIRLLRTEYIIPQSKNFRSYLLCEKRKL